MYMRNTDEEAEHLGLAPSPYFAAQGKKMTQEEVEKMADCFSEKERLQNQVESQREAIEALNRALKEVTEKGRENAEYYERMQEAMEFLANQITDHYPAAITTDDRIVTWTGRKFEMLIELVKASGLQPAIIKACMMG